MVRTAREVRREAKLRNSFVEERMGHRPSGLEGMDLTEFMHGDDAELMVCRRCGVLRRREDQNSAYESDVYDTAWMRYLYPRFQQAFERKRVQYRPLLRPGAEILEVGSHLGAFLETAENWGWKPVGLDIGQETSAFARRQGGTVKRISLDDYSPGRGKPDAVFIWNCFEQLDDPRATLSRARRMLTRHGLAVVRVPNAEFYERHAADRDTADRPKADEYRWLRLLGYNNLLGFPYLTGYTLGALRQLLQEEGFEAVAEFPASLLIAPYAEMTKRARKEWRRTETEGESREVADSPWIEIVGRAVSNERAKTMIWLRGMG